MGCSDAYNYTPRDVLDFQNEEKPVKKKKKIAKVTKKKPAEMKREYLVLQCVGDEEYAFCECGPHDKDGAELCATAYLSDDTIDGEVKIIKGHVVEHDEQRRDVVVKIRDA